MDLTKILLNPIRHRIIQFYSMNNWATVSEVHNALFDIPIASLYRHMKILYENNILQKKSEQKIRGTMEITYELNPNWNKTDNNEIRNTEVQTILFDLAKQYNEYYSKKDVNPKEDMIFCSSVVLKLSDDTFMEYITRLNDITKEYLSKEDPTGKERHLIQFCVPN